MFDSVTERLLAGAVTDVTRVRDRAEATGDIDTVDDCNRVLMRLVTVERRLDCPVSYRVRP